MSEENIQIFMGDFMKNAGIAGMYYMLGASEAVRGVDYGISDDQQSLWISIFRDLFLFYPLLRYIRACWSGSTM